MERILALAMAYEIEIEPRTILEIKGNLAGEDIRSKHEIYFSGAVYPLITI